MITHSFIFTFLFISYTSFYLAHNYTVTTYKNYGENYTYSNEFLTYKGNTFHPSIRVEYRNDSLSMVDINRAEGYDNYTKLDLQNDTVFKKYLNLPKIRKISISIVNNVLKDNDKIHYITEIRQDSIFCIEKDMLFLYIIN